MAALRLHALAVAGIASVDLRDPVAAVQTLRRYVTEHGFKGLRIVQWLWELPCTHPLYYPLLTTRVELVEYLKRHGRRKVMFGTNYPMITPQAAVAQAPVLDLEPETAELFFHGNAERVFRL